MYYEKINEGTQIRITGLISNTETSITIPEYIEGLPVTEIKNRAFASVAKNGSLKILKIYGNVIPHFNANPFLGVPKITIYEKEQNRLASLQEIYYFGPKDYF
jgi:hypothetical protein